MKSKYPDSLTIQQYLDGKLEPEVAHKLEKQALEDPFLWDALEGYSTFRDPAADLSILQRQLHERIVHMQENKKVFDLSWQRLSVAAAAAVMFVTAGILFWMNSHRAPEQLASQSQQPVEVNVIDRDSVQSVIASKDEPVTASLDNQETDAKRPSQSEHNQQVPVTKKAVLSPKAQEDVAAREMAPSKEVQVGSTALASAPAAGRQAKGSSAANGNASINEVPVNSSQILPRLGWPAYREYLQLNTSKFKADPALSGVVVLALKVDAAGKVSKVTVVRGLNDAYNKEAVRIVKNGPEWTASSNGSVADVRLEVSFTD